MLVNADACRSLCHAFRFCATVHSFTGCVHSHCNRDPYRDRRFSSSDTGCHVQKIRHSRYMIRVTLPWDPPQLARPLNYTDRKSFSPLSMVTQPSYAVKTFYPDSGGPTLHLSHPSMANEYPKYVIIKGEHKSINKFFKRTSRTLPHIEIMKHLSLS